MIIALQGKGLVSHSGLDLVTRGDVNLVGGRGEGKGRGFGGYTNNNRLAGWEEG